MIRDRHRQRTSNVTVNIKSKYYVTHFATLLIKTSEFYFLAAGQLKVPDFLTLVNDGGKLLKTSLPVTQYTGCNRRNGPDFGRVFLRSYYTDITQNTYIQSSMVTEILAREV